MSTKDLSEPLYLIRKTSRDGKITFISGSRMYTVPKLYLHKSAKQQAGRLNKAEKERKDYDKGYSPDVYEIIPINMLLLGNPLYANRKHTVISGW